MSRFDTHKVTPDGVKAIEKVRELFIELEKEVDDLTVMIDARNKAIAVSDLESACMRLIKGISLLNKESE